MFAHYCLFDQLQSALGFCSLIDYFDYSGNLKRLCFERPRLDKLATFQLADLLFAPESLCFRHHLTFIRKIKNFIDLALTCFM
jgi:hypothetical protein